MNVLAFEADSTQTEGIRHVVCDLVGARLTVATSVEQLLHGLRQETPDLVLLPALVSPRQESALVETLRSLPHASHVETLITPVLPPREAVAAVQRWRRWTRRASNAPTTSAETGEFAERVHWALERARDKRAHAGADLSGQRDVALSEPVTPVEAGVDPVVTRLVEPVMLAIEPVMLSVEPAPTAGVPSSLLQIFEGFADRHAAVPEDLELADATSRLLEKLNRPEMRRTDPRDRRQYRRFAASELPGLRSARIKFGPDVALVDVSAGGALIETNARLQPESEALLELFGSMREAVVPFRVLRCQIAAIDGSPRYLGACVFKEPLDLDELAWASATAMSDIEPGLPALTLVPAPARTAVRNAW